MKSIKAERVETFHHTDWLDKQSQVPRTEVKYTLSPLEVGILSTYHSAWLVVNTEQIVGVVRHERFEDAPPGPHSAVDNFTSLSPLQKEGEHKIFSTGFYSD